ncbi:BatA domain-containing protein [Winogradskyella alexanderae]|uniref:BatA and WFA domain-containing protein n=1 Tax=Winogradskyella alexanderae TaxID=2877123 RepID=A0ABS7XWX4_9FLAO|nr:BatA domain-containing protein [Winogradskyella alexanderae]MCA0133506.1 BatA and WFA domain-containing protein [Winogradskyella alexanderae]
MKRFTRQEGMQFKHPELLYALFILIIPILIHLFQLRRFQKVEFTNVKFLKSVNLQTRKSSQIKKWLTLITRLLLTASIVLAFSQPFIPKTNNFNEKQETVIYLDNSFSMQAKGQNGSLLNETIQDVINTIPEDETLSLFTNDKTFANTSIKAIKNELINLNFTPIQLNYDAALLKGKQLFSNETNTEKNLVLVSDFQVKNGLTNIETDSAYNLSFVQPKSNLKANVSIDSVYVENTNAETIDLTVNLKNYGEPLENVSVSLFNNDELLAKTAVRINDEAKTTFTVSNNTKINGRLELEDIGLQYDNSFYFNIEQKPKIKVLVINENSNSAFLNRVYTEDEFEYSAYQLDALNYNIIKEQNLIIVNELKSLSNALITALVDFKKDGGSILIIPSNNIILNTYNQLFDNISISSYDINMQSNKRLTTINYDHPLLANSFYARVNNFQYPRIDNTYKFNNNVNGILFFEDGSVFLQGIKNGFAFSSSLNNDNTNFKNSPLIVPVLYNIGLQSLKLPKLYYKLGQPNAVAIETAIGQDDILSLHKNELVIIPPQKSYSRTVTLEIGEYPDSAGIFQVKNGDAVLQNISFNYSRDESNTNYLNLESFGNINTHTSLANTIKSIKSNANVNALWKWFVIFALIFLIIELLILKYLK